ncbi:MAG: TonB-dependent receptor [Lentimicrobiaceae bacterium]|nr:TonB-dependent receptor [Lentimicrobiaceae bacterium]
MKKFLFLVMLLLFVCLGTFAQNAFISGKVLDAGSNDPVEGVIVTAGTMKTLTEADGSFILKNPATGNITISFTMQGYETIEKTVSFEGKNLNLGSVQIKLSSQNEAADNGISEISLANLDSDDETKDQSISGLLQSSNDIYVSTSAYTFGTAYYRIRGYDNENQSVYINNIMVNDIENGRATWSEWGGLNDATRNKEVINGLNTAKFSFGNLGGTTNILTRASMQRKQTKISYALSNRTYANRLMFTYSTGLMENNWAITLSGSRRWGDEGYVDGTFYDAWAYFLGVEKKINNQHSIALTAFGAPTRRGQQGGTVKEVYDILDNKYYNPNWGYQDGEKRNAKVKNFHEPMFLLNHYWTISPKTKLTTSLAYSFGKNGTTSLNWYNAMDPRPDYYRNLPNYQSDPNIPINPVVKEYITNQWKTNSNVSQINWDRLYKVNYLNNLEGKQASYTVENNITDHNQCSFNTFLTQELNFNTTFTGGIDITSYTASHYKELDDLLGGKYWIDIDDYAQRDFPNDPNRMQNDINHPNRIIKEGDKFEYNYDIHQNSENLWAQVLFNYKKFDFSIAGSITQTTFWRDGKMKNGRYPGSSYGESPKKDFTNFGIKGGLTYKINGRNFITANAAYLTRAPFVKNAFIAPKIRNDFSPDLTSEKISSFDLSYLVRYPSFNARLTVYNTTFENQIEINNFYYEENLTAVSTSYTPTFVNQVMTGINKTHQGLEFGAEYKLTSQLSFIGVAGWGNYRYTNRPKVTTSFENGSMPDSTKLVYCKNFYVNGTPQTAASLGIKYNVNYWFFEVKGNYFAKMYLDFSADRRTLGAVYFLGEDDPRRKEIAEQEELPDAFTLDVSIGKSWKIKDYFLNVNLSMSNILNNQDLITGGYEQGRFDYETKDASTYPSKYYYAYGRTFFLNLGFRF